MSTKAQLRTKIKLESRISSGTDMDILIDSVVEDILVDYCNLARFDELLVTDVVIALTDKTDTVALPVNFQNLAALRFGFGPDPYSSYRTLIQHPTLVRRSTGLGYPRYYRRTAVGLSLYPYRSILATDTLVIDYYVNPMSLYTTEDSAFPVPRLEGAVKKDAIARIQRVHADAGANVTKMDGKASFISSQA